MFSYPYSTVPPLKYTREEMITLKPLMKSQCIRSDNEFERAFQNMWDYTYNKTEIFSQIGWRSFAIGHDVLNQFPTSWLAQRRNYTKKEVIFFQDKLHHLLQLLQSRTYCSNTEEQFKFEDVSLPFGINIQVFKRFFRFTINSNKQLFWDCPISATSRIDIVKLTKLTIKLVREAIKLSICLSVPKSVSPDTKVKLSLPITMQYQCLPANGYFIDNEGVYEQELGCQFTEFLLSNDNKKSDQVEVFVSAVLESMSNCMSNNFTVNSVQVELDAVYGFEPLKPAIRDDKDIELMSWGYKHTGHGMHFSVSQLTLDKIINSGGECLEHIHIEKTEECSSS